MSQWMVAPVFGHVCSVDGLRVAQLRSCTLSLHRLIEIIWPLSMVKNFQAGTIGRLAQP